MKISKEAAIAIVRAEALALSRGEAVDQSWISKIERLSQLCQGQARTHIAFLGTQILAKCVNRNVDLYAIKPTHAIGNDRAYSARSLCHGVLVPLSADLGFHIGVTGREPLNNQPYFRMTHLGDQTPVHSMSTAAFDYMLELVAELEQMNSETQALIALRAFIFVRSGYQPRYGVSSAAISVKPEELASVIFTFVQENSEHGRRAQAAVAGLMDVAVGTTRVVSGRINDPSRDSPGDVCIKAVQESDEWEKAFEVRDKPVSEGDVQIFGQKCVGMGVREVALVMLSTQQTQLDILYLTRWANGLGIGLTLFYGWEDIVGQALFWSELSKPEAAIQAVEHIADRLVAIEASQEGVERWHSLTSNTASNAN
ncbi:restriction endonuclease, SacI family [Pseudomonas fulva]|uniref:restriction endonuclease, SacI family n=1 Tax=Pseudomonas fulva TaxID=47880 RepID=UPI0018AB6CD9|nr:restriction endonuclease, SacI family [Pseudomonas fulva]MBF8637662.1 restriction endonuclease, SacI family [Pseudomonas fulva]MBF8687024.1 restriction endonuclease, SacI family [Pseudomonas fulva]